MQQHQQQPPTLSAPQQRSVTFSHLPSDRERVARLRVRDFVPDEVQYPYSYLCCFVVTVLVFLHAILKIMGYLTTPLDEDKYEIE